MAPPPPLHPLEPLGRDLPVIRDRQDEPGRVLGRGRGGRRGEGLGGAAVEDGQAGDEAGLARGAVGAEDGVDRVGEEADRGDVVRG